MKFRPLWFALAMMIASASVAHARDYDSGNGSQPPAKKTKKLPHQARTLEHKVQRLEAQLKARGYEVARGSFKLFTTDECQYTIDVIGNCLGNNPAAPYIIAAVPLWPGEFLDESLRNLIGPLPKDAWATYRFDKREAMLVFGLLPPPGGYFGLQTYVFSRAAQINRSDPIYLGTLADPIMNGALFGALPKNPSRLTMFASIGNSNNNVVIERQSGAAFNQQRSFVISPDAAMAREMTEALVHARVSGPDQVFTEPVSPEIARIGLGAEADDFLTLIRYAQPGDELAGDQWRHQIPLAVLRVRDRNAAATEPWPTPSYDPKTARSELGFEGDLTALVAAVKQQWGQPSATVEQSQSLQLAVDLIGQHCLPRPMNCLGDTQDTDYQLSPQVSIDDGQVIAVAGTLGTATGNATYVSLSVNWFDVLKGVGNISDADLEGSTSRFSGTVGNTDKLYLHYFARDCTGLSDCFEITEDLVPRGGGIKIVQRNYIVPGTARGPDPNQLLNPVTIVLDGTARPASR
jgi:hypothetical protein